MFVRPVVGADDEDAAPGLAMRIGAGERPSMRRWFVAAIEPGETIEATVERLEPYGAWVTCDGARGLINIPEISWDPIPHPSATLAVGQVVRARVLAIAGGEFRASIRALHPELDPWYDPASFAPGTTFDAPVALVLEYGAFVELKPNLRGLLRRDRWPHPLRVGDRLRVVVEAVDAAGRKVDVAVDAPPPERPPGR